MKTASKWAILLILPVKNKRRFWLRKHSFFELFPQQPSSVSQKTILPATDILNHLNLKQFCVQISPYSLKDCQCAKPVSQIDAHRYQRTGKQTAVPPPQRKTMRVLKKKRTEVTLFRSENKEPN